MTERKEPHHEGHQGLHKEHQEKSEQDLMQPLTKSLLDLRGSVPVSEAQDFDAIRHKVIAERPRRSSEK